MTNQISFFNPNFLATDNEILDGAQESKTRI
jgi:hypothetical protein